MTGELPFKEWLRGRYEVYSYLSDVYFDVPSMKTVSKTRGIMDFLRTLSSTANVEEITLSADIYSLFIQDINGYKDDEAVTRLNMEYTALFMRGDRSVPFFESAFLGKDAGEVLAIQRSAADFFIRAGIKPKTRLKIPEDAICHELDYMGSTSAVMSGCQDNEKLRQAMFEQRDFLSGHILSWIGLFREAVCKRAGIEGSLFYQATALFTEGFARYDYMLIQELLDE